MFEVHGILARLEKYECQLRVRALTEIRHGVTLNWSIILKRIHTTPLSISTTSPSPTPGPRIISSMRDNPFSFFEILLRSYVNNKIAKNFLISDISGREKKRKQKEKKEKKENKGFRSNFIRHIETINAEINITLSSSAIEI